ncbi:MAG: hypothetical protein IH840_02705 [Candidatus Heimdallarchaeota archaeon]|nr:hypothetical protein [Candidatus Heimdallarchaeota archaeon]
MNKETYVRNILKIRKSILEVIISDDEVNEKIRRYNEGVITTEFLAKQVWQFLLKESTLSQLRKDQLIQDTSEIYKESIEDPYMVCFRDAIYELIQMGLLRLSGGGVFMHGEYSLTQRGILEIDNQRLNPIQYPSEIIRKVAEDLFDQVNGDAEIQSIKLYLNEALDCYTANLFRPTIIISLLGTITLIDIIADQLKNALSKETHRHLTKVKNSKTEEKMNNIITFVGREEFSAIRVSKIISLTDIKARLHNIRSIRNKIMYPEDLTERININYNEAYLVLIDFIEICKYLIDFTKSILDKTVN